MTVTIKVKGLRDLERAMVQLRRPVAKAAMRRALVKAGEPMARAARGMAPRDENDLVESIDVGTKLARSTARQHRKMFADDRAAVEVFVGPGALAQAIMQEFGTYKEPPQAFMRPAFDQTHMLVLERIKVEATAELEKAVERAVRRAARGR